MLILTVVHTAPKWMREAMNGKNALQCLSTMTCTKQAKKKEKFLVWFLLTGYWLLVLEILD